MKPCQWQKYFYEEYEIYLLTIFLLVFYSETNKMLTVCSNADHNHMTIHGPNHNYWHYKVSCCNTSTVRVTKVEECNCPRDSRCKPEMSKA